MDCFGNFEENMDQSRIHLAVLEQFFLTVGQNKFGNKIPIFFFFDIICIRRYIRPI